MASLPSKALQIGLFSLVCLTTTAQAHMRSLSDQDDRDTASSSGIVDYYEGLRPDSLRILKEAISRTNKSIYQEMYDDLSSASIAEGPDCDSDTEAYVNPGENTIYVCQTGDVGYNIRTLLHESVHLTGIDNECDADYYSGLAEIDSGEGLTGSGGYDDECPNSLQY